MSDENKEKIGAMWDLFTRIFTGVLLAAFVGVYAQLQDATIELAKTNVTLVAMGNTITDHEARLRTLELSNRARGTLTRPNTQ